jgi:hypothetical protein
VAYLGLTYRDHGNCCYSHSRRPVTTLTRRYRSFVGTLPSLWQQEINALMICDRQG